VFVRPARLAREGPASSDESQMVQLLVFVSVYEMNQVVIRSCLCLYQRSVTTLYCDVVNLPSEKPHRHFIEH
jgi:hypothetical protein